MAKPPANPPGGTELPEPVARKLLDALWRLSPPMQRAVVEHPDPTMNMRFLKLADVCFITTQVDLAGRTSMLVTSAGEKFYSGESLTGWMKKFEAGNPWFMRTHESYIVNLAKVVGIRRSSARDLWFEGLPDPVINAVSDSKRAEFDAWVGL